MPALSKQEHADRWQQHVIFLRAIEELSAKSDNYVWLFDKRIRYTEKQGFTWTIETDGSEHAAGPAALLLGSQFVWDPSLRPQTEDEQKKWRKFWWNIANATDDQYALDVPSFNLDTYRFIVRSLAKFPPQMRRDIWFKYRSIVTPNLQKCTDEVYVSKAYTEANKWLVSATQKIHEQHRFFAYGERGLKKLAQQFTSHITNKAQTKMLSFDLLDDGDAALDTIRPAAIAAGNKYIATAGRRACKKLGINPAGGTIEVQAKKYTDEAFWTRRLRRVNYPQFEQLCKDLGLLSKSSSHYSSQGGQAIRKNMLENQKRWSESVSAFSPDQSKEIPMTDLIATAEKGHAAQVVAWSTGLKKLADANGWTAALVTITCPGTFRKDGTTIQEALAHLRAVWKRINAQVKKDQLQIAGLQVWQPHKDAFPHQHIYVIGSETDISEFYSIVQDKALAVYPNENGAAENRTDIIWENTDKGSLSSYALSYCLRFTGSSTGEALEKDGSAEDTWYSMNRARRIGWFGLPEQTHWDTCRKMTRSQTTTKKLRGLRKAARRGDFAAWVNLSGGIAITRKDRGFTTITENRLSKYGEKVARYIGSVIDSVDIIIKGAPWKIEMAAVVKPNYPREAKPNQNQSQNRNQNRPTGPPAVFGTALPEQKICF